MKILDLYKLNPNLSKDCHEVTSDACIADHAMLCTNLGRVPNPNLPHYFPNPQQQQQQPRRYDGNDDNDKHGLLFGLFPRHCDLEIPSFRMQELYAHKGKKQQQQPFLSRPSPQTACSSVRNNQRVLVMPTIYTDKKVNWQIRQKAVTSSPFCIRSRDEILEWCHHATSSTPAEDSSSSTFFFRILPTNQTFQWQSNNSNGNATMIEATQLYPYDYIPVAEAPPFQLHNWMVKDIWKQEFTEVVTENDKSRNSAGGRRSLTVQWQCCDDHGHYYLTTGNKNTSLPFSLWNGLSLMNSKQPQSPYKAILCTPNMCPNQERKIHPTKFTNQAALGWLLDHLVQRVANLSRAIVRLAQKHWQPQDKPLLLKSTNALIENTAKRILDLFMISLMDLMTVGENNNANERQPKARVEHHHEQRPPHPLILVNAEGDILHVFSNTTAGSSDPKQQFLLDVSSLAEVMLNRQAKQTTAVRSDIWKLLMKQLVSVSQQEYHSMLNLEQQKRLLERNRARIPLLCEDGPCMHVDSIPIPLYNRNSNNNNFNMEEEDPLLSLIGENASPSFEDFDPHQQEALYRISRLPRPSSPNSQQHPLDARISSSCLWNNYLLQTLPNEGCANAMEFCHASLIATFERNQDIEKQSGIFGACQIFYAVFFLMIQLSSWTMMERKRNNSPAKKWKRIRQMLHDPILRQGMKRDAEERLGSLEAAEKHLQELEEQATHYEQQQALMPQEQEEGGSATPVGREEPERKSKLWLLPLQAKHFKLTMVTGISMSFFLWACYVLTDVFPLWWWSPLLATPIGTLIGNAVTCHSKSPCFFQHKSMNHVKDVARLTKTLTTSLYVLLFDLLTMQRWEGSGIPLLENGMIRHVISTGIFLLSLAQCMRQIWDSQRSQQQRDIATGSSMDVSSNIEVGENSNAATPLLQDASLSLRRRG